MRLIAGLFSLALLASCGTVSAPPEGEAVSIQKLLSDTNGRPYECFGYEEETDSCAAIAKRVVRGNTLGYNMSVLVPGPNWQAVKVNIDLDFQIVDGRYCGNYKQAEITSEGNLTPAQRSLLEELMLAELLMMGDFCEGYLQTPSGTYYSVTSDRLGQVYWDSSVPVAFFARPKKLRLNL
ncbi:MAG: hypothetical protein AAFY06_07690 [Pseudomonadota bacterium]